MEPGSISSKWKIKLEQQQAVCIREANKLLSVINDTFKQTAHWKLIHKSQKDEQ